MEAIVNIFGATPIFNSLNIFRINFNSILANHMLEVLYFMSQNLTQTIEHYVIVFMKKFQNLFIFMISMFSRFEKHQNIIKMYQGKLTKVFLNFSNHTPLEKLLMHLSI